jgi:hypothetical protein
MRPVQAPLPLDPRLGGDRKALPKRELGRLPPQDVDFMDVAEVTLGPVPSVT